MSDSQSTIVPDTQPPETQYPETQPPETQYPETQSLPESLPETQPDTVIGSSMDARVIYSATYMADLFERLLDETPVGLRKFVGFMRAQIKRLLPVGMGANVSSKVDELLEPTPKFLEELKASMTEWCTRGYKSFTLDDQSDRPPARLLGLLHSLIHSYSPKGYMHDSPTPLTHVPFVYTTVTGIISDVIYCFKVAGLKKRRHAEEDAEIKRKRKREIEEEMAMLPPCICGLQSVKTFTSFPTNEDELPRMYCSRKCSVDDEAAEAELLRLQYFENKRQRV